MIDISINKVCKSYGFGNILDNISLTLSLILKSAICLKYPILAPFLIEIIPLLGFSSFAISFISINERAKDNDRRMEEFRENHNLNDDNHDLEGYSVKVGYLNNVGSVSTLLEDYASFKSFFYKYNNKVYDGTGNVVKTTADEVLNKYDEEFFEEKSLAVKYISVNSGSITSNKVYGTIDGEKIKITYEENRPEVGTMDMSGYFLIVEVSKKIKEVA